VCVWEGVCIRVCVQSKRLILFVCVCVRYFVHRDSEMRLSHMRMTNCAHEAHDVAQARLMKLVLVYVCADHTTLKKELFGDQHLVLRFR